MRQGKEGKEKGGKERRTLKDGSEVDGGTSTNTLSVVALLEETVDTTDGELKSGLGGSRSGLLGVAALGGGGLARLSLSRPEEGKGVNGGKG